LFAGGTIVILAPTAGHGLLHRAGERCGEDLIGALARRAIDRRALR